MSAGRRIPERTELLFAFFGGLLLLFIVAPLSSLFLRTGFSGLFDAAGDQEIVQSIWLTIWTAMGATLATAVPAVPFAWLLARRQFPLKGLVCGILDLPVMIPHSAAGIALLGLMARNAPVGSAFHKIGVEFIGRPAGIIVVMAFVSLPFLINAARNGFEAVPRRLEQAALNLGASPTRVFVTISLPLAWRSILSGLIMMWARGLSEFGAVVIVAYHPMVTPVLIYERFGAYGLKYAQPVTALFILICLTVFLILRTVSGKGPRVTDR
jgi:molybdate/tungstate transport system permease protein